MHIILVFILLMFVVLFWRLAVKTLSVIVIVGALACGVFYEAFMDPTSHAATAAPTVAAGDQGKEWCDMVMVNQSDYHAEQITDCRNLHPDRYGKAAAN
ncbi:hypothetical protein [Paraburkholderia fungorum]|uniref:hypothetical protein n=1 Tax=Paraburkholderia fungorum TaxID=134537 RepID=UPI00209308CC|nr:hypothetical protein [Paraburkholderia fungorum]USU15362.1 hypothetical protein NFE55_17520 [Paraburkholderia fungorum]USU23307.1 hypothetical protein NFS19_17520 [Paraburkholderia fungorum]